MNWSQQPKMKSINIQKTATDKIREDQYAEMKEKKRKKKSEQKGIGNEAGSAKGGMVTKGGTAAPSNVAGILSKIGK
jgi:hypothetical protein